MAQLCVASQLHGDSALTGSMPCYPVPLPLPAHAGAPLAREGVAVVQQHVTAVHADPAADAEVRGTVALRLGWLAARHRAVRLLLHAHTANGCDW